MDFREQLRALGRLVEEGIGSRRARLLGVDRRVLGAQHDDRSGQRGRQRLQPLEDVITIATLALGSAGDTDKDSDRLAVALAAEIETVLDEVEPGRNAA